MMDFPHKTPPPSRISHRYVELARINGPELVKTFMAPDGIYGGAGFPVGDLQSALSRRIWQSLHHTSAYCLSPYADYYCYLAVEAGMAYFRSLSR